jgi:hypothetical protein
MSDKPIPKTNAPLYANAYATLVPIARAHGYALAVHGSMARDLDLIAVPWVAKPSTPAELVAAFEKSFFFMHVDAEPTVKEHGRLCYTLAWPGECFMDLSVMQTIQ